MLTTVTEKIVNSPVNEINKNYTREEYLNLEENAEYKHEYRDGKIVAMTGGTTNHNEIASNFLTYLKIALKSKNYRVFIGDVRLWIPQYQQYTYPDLMVIKNKPIYEGKGKTTVTNPMLIVEVLSKSTQDYDKGTKFDYYRSIPEFQEYILIDQYKYAVQQFAKNDQEKWVLTDYHNAAAILTLEHLDFSLSLADIYDRIDLDTVED
jgi:Uma2 family endonuclease